MEIDTFKKAWRDHQRADNCPTVPIQLNEKEITKSKPAKLYIPFFNPNGTVTFISANKRKYLLPYLPTDLMLAIFMRREKLRLKKYPNSKPMPLRIGCPLEVIEHLEDKIKMQLEDHIVPLTFGVTSIPIVLLFPEKDDSGKCADSSKG